MDLKVFVIISISRGKLKPVQYISRFCVQKRCAKFQHDGQKIDEDARSQGVLGFMFLHNFLFRKGIF